MKRENIVIIPLLFLLIVFLNFFCASVTYCYRWPCDDAAGPHYIKGTLGEFRKYHFHDGVDIVPTSGVGSNPNWANIRAIEGGEVEIKVWSGPYESVKVGRFKYTHVNIVVANNVDVAKGDIIAKYKPISPMNPHLHLIEYDGTKRVNPLRPPFLFIFGGGLDNYEDSTDPSFLTGTGFYPNEKISIVAENSENKFDPSHIIKDKVDIVVNAKDSQDSNGSQTVAVYKIELRIYNSQGVNNYDYHPIEFDAWPTFTIGNIYKYDATDTYSTITNTYSRYIYWATHTTEGSQPDRTWNTKQKSGGDENTDAIKNSEGIYPDGRYKIKVTVSDIKHNSKEEEKEVIVDNFRPSIKYFKINGKGSDNDNLAKIDDIIDIEILFDQEMLTSVNPVIKYGKTGGGDWVTLNLTDILWQDAWYQGYDLPKAKFTAKAKLDEQNDQEVAEMRVEISEARGIGKFTEDGGGGEDQMMATMIDENDNEMKLFADLRKPEIDVQGPQNGSTYSAKGIVTIISGTDSPSGMVEFTGSFGDGGIDDFNESYDPPQGTDQKVHIYKRKCSDNGYSITVKVKDKAGNENELSPSFYFTITAPQCDPPCKICDDSTGTAKCKDTPSNDPRCRPRRRPRPDENVDLSTPPPTEVSMLYSYDQSSSVGVLRNGYFVEMFKLLETFGAKAALVDVIFDPSIVEQIKLLIIPSGGLYGLNNSEMFKAFLAEYVNRGGNVFCLAQQYGYEFSALPGNISGYGWSEDQSCFNQAFYIEKYHQFLSGQDVANGTSDAAVDGYFITYPSDTEVFLRRTRNGQPGLIKYPYGDGQLIVTAIYTDWAYTNAQATIDGRHLIRDIISWAKNPQDLPEFKPEETISSMPIQITYYLDDAEGNQQVVPAEKVKLTILYPDRNQYTEQVLDINIIPGEIQEIYLPSYSIPAQSSETVGIWWIDYTLLDADDNVLQEQMEGQRFVVSPADSSPYEAADYYFSIQSDSDYYPVGGRAVFTFIVFNNTDQDSQITIYPSIAPSPESIMVPANGQNQITRVIDPVRWINGQWLRGGWISARFYSSSGKHLGNISKSFSVYTPRVNLNVKTDKKVYLKGEEVLVDLTMVNANPASYYSDVIFKILDPSSTAIFQQDYGVDFGPQEVRYESLNISLPQDVGPGIYTALVEAYDQYGNKIGSRSTTFTLPDVRLSVTPILPSIFGNDNIISFDLNNLGFVEVSDVSISVSLKDPDDNEIWSSLQENISVASGGTTPVDFDVLVSEIYLGNYKLDYIVTYGEKSLTGRKIITSAIHYSFSIDRSIYRLNEIINLHIDISNPGKFHQEFILTTRIPDIGYEDIRSLSMDPEDIEKINLTPVIEETTLSGSHSVEVEIELVSGQVILKQRDFTVEDILPSVSIFFEDYEDRRFFRIREDLVMDIILRNRGKFVDVLDVEYELIIPDFGYTDTQTLSLVPNEEILLPYTIPIPETLIEGQHSINVSLTFPNGLIKEEKFVFSIKESSLLINIGKRVFVPLETVELWLNNEGGVDADYDCSLSLYDAYAVKIYEGNFSGNSLAGELEILSFTIPASSVSGEYVIAGECRNLKTGEITYCDEHIEIIGNSANLTTETDKEVYFSTDLKNILTNITNTSSLEINDAILDLKIYSTEGCLPISGEPSSVTPLPPPPSSDQQGDIHDYIEEAVNYAWEGEIGTGLNQEDDDYDLIDLGFIFRFYGEEYTHIYVCSNGWLSFDGSNNLYQYSNPVFPTTNYKKVIAPLWDDWNPACMGDVYYNTLSNPTRFVATWDVVPHYSCTGSNTFQAVLYENGTIQFNYNEIQSPSGVSIGLNEGDGVHYNYSNVYPTSGTSRLYTYQALTVSITPILQFVQLANGEVANFTAEASDPMGNPIVSYEWDFDDRDGIQVDATGQNVTFDYSMEGKYIVTLTARNDQGGFSVTNAYVYVQGIPPDETINPASTLTTTEQSMNIGITIPLDNEIYCGDSLPVEGFVNVGGVDVGNLNVVYVIDLSGSTGYSSACCYDINGDGIINSLDNYNGDGQNGDILDAEIAGIIALNQSLGDPSGVSVGVVGFGQSASPADVSPEPFEQLLTESPQIDLDYNGIPDIVDVVTSMDSGSGEGSIGLFTYKWVGETTNFEAALSATYEILSSSYPDENSLDTGSYVFFLSDGRPSYSWSAYTSQALDNLIAINTIVNTYGVTSAALPTYLRPMAERTGGTYTQVLNPSDLTTELGTVRPIGIDRVAVNGIEVGLTPIGTFYTILSEFAYGTNVIHATAYADDGTVISANISIIMGQQTDDNSALVWETEMPVNVVDSLNLTTPFEISLTGKFYLIGELISSTSQRLGYDTDEFFIIDNEIQPSITTDKRIYKQGETVEINGGVLNASSLEANNLNIRVLADGIEIYNKDFDLQVGESHSFILNSSADIVGPVKLECILSQNAIELITVSERYEVSVPITTAQLSAPNTVGNDPFEVEIEINNTANVEASIHLTLLNQSTGITEGEVDVTVLPKTTRIVSFSTQINTDTSFIVGLAGDHMESIHFDVIYGLSAQITVTPKTYYSEGIVEIPYNITNTGLLSDYYPVELYLYDQTDQLINSFYNSHYLINIVGNNTSEGMAEFFLYEGSYTLRYQTIGDEGEISFNVVKPAGAVAITVSNVYPAGEIQIPYLVENIGLVASEFEFRFDLYQGMELINSFQSTIFLNSSEDDPFASDYIGISFAGNLQYNLSSGNYIIESFIGYELYETRPFQVISREATQIETIISNPVEGRIPLSISVSNTGYDAFSGTIRAETDFWSEENPIEHISSEGQETFEFSINLFASNPGVNELRIYLYNASGNPVDTIAESFSVNGPQFVITHMPPHSQFPAGGTGSLTFGVKNEGDQEGHISLMLEALDGSEIIPAHLEISEEQSFTFTFPIPEDLEERDYMATYSLRQITNGTENIVAEGRVTFHVTNVKVDIIALLDKELYQAGDTAHVTLDIQNIGSISNVSLITRINFANFEDWEPFTLSETGNILEFDVPIDYFDGRLLYEVMMESGRSIYINTLYIHEKYERIWLYTDKQVYLPGEEVEITIEAGEEGIVNIEALYGLFTQEISLVPYTPVTISMALPANLIGGTEIIIYNFKEVSQVYQFDVDSYQAEFIEVKLDKSQYQYQDTFQVDYQLLTNSDMDGYLDGFVEDPDGWLTQAFTYYGNFTKGLNAFSVIGEIDTDQTGLHKLYYLLYKDEDRTQLMTVGSEAFDVGNFSITQMVTDKSIYIYGLDNIVATVYFYGEIEGSLILYLDGQIIFTEDIISSGFNHYEFTILADQITEVGTQTIMAVLSDIDSPISDTETVDITVQVLQPSLCPNEYRWSTSHDPVYEWDPYPEIFRSWTEVYFQNSGPGDAYNVTATISCTPDNTIATEPMVTIGDIPAGDSAWSWESFALQVDMTNLQDPDKGICWRVEYDDSAGIHHVIEDVAKYCGEVCSNICP